MRYIDFTVSAWTNREVRVMARNACRSRFDLATATLSLQVVEQPGP